MKRILLLLVAAIAPALFGQTAADKISAGRTALAAHDLTTAQARFSEALALEPANQTAAALLGFTRCFAITSTTSGAAFLTRMGMPTSGRDIYDWNAALPRDAQNNVILPTGYNLTDAASLSQSTILPTAEAARANFAIVTNPAFTVTFTTAETGMPADVTVDYADILTARAALRFAEFGLHIASGQNLDLNIQAIVAGNFTAVQDLLSANPNFLKIGSVSERTAAKTALLDAIALYRQASVAIRARPAGLSRLFMLDPALLPDEELLRVSLADVERSVTEAAEVKSGVYVSTAPLFTTDWNLRGFFPTVSGNSFDYYSIIDASFGGLVSGATRADIAGYLNQYTGLQPSLGFAWVSPSPDGNSLRRLAVLSNGALIGVGEAGKVLVYDGSTPATGTIPHAGVLSGLATDGTKVVAGGSGSLYASLDGGATWKPSGPQMYGTFRALTYGGGRFVAANNHGNVLSSTDGLNWSQTQISWYTLNDVIYTGTEYLVVGLDPSSGKGIVYASANGTAWTSRFTSAKTNSEFVSIVAGGSRIVIVGANGSCAVSTNSGVSWTEGTVGATVDTYQAVAYQSGVFVAGSGNGRLMKSSDGVTWTEASISSPPIYGLTPTNYGLLVMVAGGGVLATTDGTTLAPMISPQTVLPAGSTLLGVRSIDTQLYVTGTGGNILRTSDGINYSAGTTGVTAAIWDVIKQGTKFYAVGNSGTILTSTDGATWSAVTSGVTDGLRSISYLNNQFIVTGGNGVILTSPDGTTWTKRSTTTGYSLYGVAYGNGVYVATGGNTNNQSLILTSPDAVTWTAQTGTTFYSIFRGIVFNQGTFTTVGTNGTVVRSADGVSWYYVSIPGYTDCLGIRVLDGRYHVTQSYASAYSTTEQSAVLVSDDGVNWASCPIGACASYYGIDQFQGRLYTVGTSAGIIRSAVQPAVATAVLKKMTADKQARQGDDLTLAAASTGDGLRYAWTKNSAPLTTTDSGLRLRNVQTSDAGTYVVTATNAKGVTTTSTFTITVDPTPVAPMITQVPKSQTVPIGCDAVFTVKANGTLPYTYQWKHGGVSIPGATLATLSLHWIQAADAGNYSVVVTNAGGSTTSAEAILTMDPNPVYVFSTPAGLAYNSGWTDGVGAAVRFSTPAGVAVTADSTLYVSETGTHLIRKVLMDGTTTVVAGAAWSTGTTDGVGAVARFNNPMGLALDAAGYLYVADNGNNKIRKIELSTRTVSTLASVSNPVGIAADASGNVYVTTGQHTVCLVTPTGVVTTIAGADNAAAFLNGTGTAARFNRPMGIAVDASGNLYVADSGNYVIRKIAANRSVTTYAGRPNVGGVIDGPAASALFADPEWVAIDAVGGVYVTEMSPDLVRRVGPDGVVRTIGGQPFWSGSSDGAGANAHFYSPAGVAVDYTGYVFVADSGSSVVRRGTPSVAIVAPVIATQLQGTTFIPGGSLSLTITATGAAPLSYQWMKDGAAISGATSATYSKSNLQASDAGTYSVVITNAYGTTRSAGATVVLAYPPRVAVAAVRAQVGTGEKALLASFTIEGGTRKVLVRAVGPSLAQFNIVGALADPVLAVYDQSGTQIATNDDWGSTTELVSAAAAVGAWPLTTGSKDSVLLLTLPAGTYTARVTGALGTTGSVLIEAYECEAVLSDTARIAYASSRAPVTSGLPAILGFALSGTGTTPQSLLIRGVGAPLVTGLGALDNPKLAVFNSSGTQLAANDDWGTNANAADITTATTLTGAMPIAPTDAAVLLSLTPGTYTTQVSSSGTSSGFAMVELHVADANRAAATTPALLAPVFSRVAKRGAAVYLNAPAMAKPGPLSYVWRRDGVAVTTTTVANAPGALFIPAFAPENSGSYVVSITNTAGTTNCAPCALNLAHDSDTNADGSINLAELTRAIELYNTRYGTVRTGSYAVATTATEDGFAPEPTRPSTTAATLSVYHTADSNHDGRIDLIELTRVIQLYNTHVGTTRTGFYHAEAGTEDGYATGP